MRVVSAAMLLGALLIGVVVLPPGQERHADDAPICGAGVDADAHRRAVLAAIVREIDTAASRGGRAADVERARREVLAHRVEALRPRVQAVFDEIATRASEALVRAGSAAPAGAVERLRAAHLRWIDPRETAPRDERALRRGCGTDLVADDAWVDKTGSEVVLCPGLLLVAEAEGDLREGLAFLIAHELGHVIVGPAATSGRAERVAESEADRWAGRILRSMLRRRSPSTTERFLRVTLEPICAPKADGTHASGPDRVRAVLGELAS